MNTSLVLGIGVKFYDTPKCNILPIVSCFTS